MNICEYRKLYKNEMMAIINSKKICNFGSIHSNTADIIPLWYVFDSDDNDNLTFYFINMNDEANLNDLKDTDKVCIAFENYILDFYMGAYQSVTAHGTPHLVTDYKEKERILSKFKKKYSITECQEKTSGFTYIKVPLDDISGRQY
ncbi:MAG: pyridoxamine 5'-phosphate oxidase family protein [Clostridium sp.]|nr:pyridoxamine 5'-phosphate oxidase family protein [Clostridium sp.]